MNKKEIKLTNDFKRQTIKAVIAIFIFLISYLTLVLLALALTGLSIVGGFYLIALKPMFFTIAIGLGLVAMALLVVIFLLKFLFKSHKVNRLDLIEINEAEEPELFQLINDIVLEVGTHFPKKVYLSADVNASVFYDSSFWSMFLPVKKNLQIGLGLVNSVTKQELKAILAHEFGHFSQRTMKVGSYVYNVNQVIFNMLYDNESYEELQQRWASTNDYIYLFVKLASRITEGIKWVLIKLYGVVNISYMALSREMEFHADEIAASITGYEPLKKSLLRLTVADNAYNNVLNYYNNKISDNVKSESIYNDHTAVIHYLSELNNLPVSNQLPDVALEEQSKYDKSKLVIKNQWASHPSTKDRIERLEKTGYTSTTTTDTLANELFMHLPSYQQQLTNKVFETVTYEGEVTQISTETFITDYKQELKVNSFGRVFNGYYDNHNPTSVDVNKTILPNIQTWDALYADDKVDLVYTSAALQSDIETLKNIAINAITIKTFDYDGIKYKKNDAEQLLVKLEDELKHLNEKIANHNQDIYCYFITQAQQQNKAEELQKLYSDFIAYDKTYEPKFELYVNLLNSLNFVSVTTPFEQIRSNLTKVNELEVSLKQELKVLLADPILIPEITKEMRDQLEKYIPKDLIYFVEPAYNNENLNTLYTAIHQYSYLILRKYFLLKRAILVYQENLLLA